MKVQHLIKARYAASVLVASTGIVIGIDHFDYIPTNNAISSPAYATAAGKEILADMTCNIKNDAGTTRSVETELALTLPIRSFGPHVPALVRDNCFYAMADPSNVSATVSFNNGVETTYPIMNDTERVLARTKIEARFNQFRLDYN